MEPSRTIIARFVIVLTTLIGGGTLLLFGIFLFRGSYRLVDFGLSTGEALTVDAFLCLASCVQHSLMVRKSIRRRVERIVPSDYYGALYTVVSAVPLLTLLGLWQNSRFVIAGLVGPGRWLAHALFLVALLGLLWGERSIAQFDPFGVRPIRARLRGREPKPSPFAVRGAYRWVRHPQYFFTLVLFWARPNLTADRLVLNAIFTIWVLFGTILEERDLVVEFGDDYVEYQRRVPMLIPWRGPLAS